MTRYLAPQALLPDGWARNVLLEVDGRGTLQTVAPAADAAPGDRPPALPGTVVPGVVNAHSHAFQRALAGGAETRTGPGDSFWSWREQMYRFLRRMGPDDVEAVASRLYVELLRHGYTRVVEFHYLHNDPAGRPYGDRAEVARRLVAAAERVGIGITLLPVLYQASDFGGVRPTDGQGRFVLDTDSFLRLVEEVRTWSSPLVTPGFAFHSLRAVPSGEMDRVLAVLGDTSLPRHIHVAEQPREVEACVAWSGRRPVEWLLDHAPVDGRWGLVHCTHMTREEGDRLARSGAVAVVCPTTEANLGDGIFPLPRHLSGGGVLAVGSDSHVSVSPVEELRWLEYGQRLTSGERAVAASDELPSVGRRLLEAVWRGGSAAAGVEGGRLAPGCRADWVVLDPDHPALVGRGEDGLLDAWLFSGNDSPVREVWVGGRPVTDEGVHPLQDSTARGFRDAMKGLLARG